MLKRIIALSIALTLTACNKVPPTPDAAVEASDAVVSASEVAASEIASIYDNPSDASEEWQPNPEEDVTMSPDDWEREFQDSEQQVMDNSFHQMDHFKVMRQVEVFQGQDAITVQKISEEPMTVTNIIINRGNCGLLNKPDPKALPYSGKMTVYLWGCNAIDVLEVQVVTDKGTVPYTF